VTEKTSRHASAVKSSKKSNKVSMKKSVSKSPGKAIAKKSSKSKVKKEKSEKPEKKVREGGIPDHLKKNKIDPSVVQPKRNVPPVFFYNFKNAAVLRLADPTLTQPAATSKSSKMYKELTDAEREEWEDIAAKDKIRYQDEKAHFDKHGWFTMPDGSKSTEHEKKQKKKKASKSKSKNKA
jgi:hypothetical protein